MTHWTKAILPFVMRLSRDALIIVGPPRLPADRPSNGVRSGFRIRVLGRVRKQRFLNLNRKRR
jgi:hypothetical protein